uniref:Uncharacterized protein n=1 Tax=Glossina brevipalpis TaxID=37001 RepID=A0A1A9WVJ1_9MUSC
MERCGSKMRKRMLCDLSPCCCQKCKRQRDNEEEPDSANKFERWNACRQLNQQSEDRPWRQPQSDDRLWKQPQSDDRPWNKSRSEVKCLKQQPSDSRQWSPSQSDDTPKFEPWKNTMDINHNIGAQSSSNARNSFEANNHRLSGPNSSHLPNVSTAATPAFLRNVLPETLTSLVQGPSSARDFVPRVQNIVRDSITANLPNFIKDSIDLNQDADSKLIPSFLKKLKPNDLSGGSDNQTNGSILCDIVGAVSFLLMLTALFWISAALYLKDLLVKLFYARRTTQVIVLSLVFLLTLNICFQVVMQRRSKHSSTAKVVQKAKPISSGKCKAPAKTVKARKSSEIPTQPLSPCKFFRSNSPRQSGGATSDEKKEEEKKPASFFNFLRGPRCRRNCPPGEPRTYSFCAKFAENCPQRQIKKNRRYKQANKGVNTPLSDCQGKEIYKTYEKYSYPLDMKFPPAPLVYIKDCILRRMCPHPPEETEREENPCNK